MLCVGLLHFSSTNTATAAINPEINFQGKLDNPDGTNVTDGTYSIVFSIYSAASGGTAIWTETQSVTVSNGIFQVNLGSVTPLPGSINFDSSNLYLGIKVGSDAEMTPRIQFTSVPQAFDSSELGGLSSSAYAQLAANQTFTGTNSFNTNSTTAFQIQNAASSSNLFIADTANSMIGIGQAPTTSNGSTLQVGGTVAVNGNISTSTGLVHRTDGNIGVFFNTANVGTLVSSDAGTTDLRIQSSITSTLIDLYNGSTQVGSISRTGQATFENSTNSTTAFQIQNSTAANILSVDTTGNGNITVGNASNPSTISFVGGTTSLRPATPTKGQLYYDTSTNQLIQYNGTKWDSAPKTATEIVAASNSTQAEKDAADYVATGTSDQTTINAALSALPAGGGTVYLMEGTYDISNSINVPDNTTLEGSGPSTIITIPNAQNGSYGMITNSDTTAGTNVIIENLLLDGNKANQTSGGMDGVYFNGVGSRTSTSGGKIEGVTAQNLYSSSSSYGYGIYINSDNNVVTNNVSSSNDYGGIYIGGNNDTASNNIVQSNGVDGIFANSGDDVTISNNTVISNNTTNNVNGAAIWGNAIGQSTISGNVIDSGNGCGMDFNSVYDNTITANTVSSNTGVGMYYDSGDNNTISNNIVQSNTGDAIYMFDSWDNISDNNISFNGGAGIDDYGGTYNTITGNYIQDSGGSTTNEGILFAAGYSYQRSSYNIVADNNILDSSCTTTCYAIDIVSTSTGNTLSGNTFTGDGTHNATINDATTSGTIYNGQQLTQNGDTYFRNGTNSTAAFQVQNAAGTSNLLVADTTNSKIGIGMAPSGTGATLQVGGTLSVSTLGASTANSASVCRDTVTNLLTSCDSTNTTGRPFLQGGNSFGTTATLGTNDSNSLSFETNGITQATIAVGGATTFKNSTDSTTAFQVQDAASTPVLTADTSNSQVNIQGVNTSATLGSELSPSNDFTNAANWTTTGWTTTTSTATHAAGNTSPLIDTQFSVTAGTTYQVTFTISGNPTGGEGVEAWIGGSNATGSLVYGNASSEVEVITAYNTNSLEFDPTSNWNGTISGVSVKILTSSNSVLNILNSDGSTALQVRGNDCGDNALVGLNAGQSNMFGCENSAFGAYALQDNTTGQENTASGAYALQVNTTGQQNTASGAYSLQDNTTGSDNTGLGYLALDSNQTGSYNIGIGMASLGQNNSGSNNIGIGRYAGISSNSTNANTSGSNNTFIGYDSGPGVATQLQNATAIGTNSVVSQNDSLVLGCISGVNGCTASTQVGIGTATPSAALDVAGTALFQASSTSALQIQNAAGVSVLNVDTTDQTLTVKGQGASLNKDIGGTLNTTANGNSPNFNMISGNYMYVLSGYAAGNSDMKILDISNPGFPAQVSSVTTSQQPNGAAISGNYAYVVSGPYSGSSGTLQVFNVSDPTSVGGAIGSIATGTQPTSIAISGNYAYIADSSGIQVFNITTPWSPSLVGTVATISSGWNTVTISGNYLYVGAQSYGLQVFNISTPSSPTSVGSVATSSSAWFPSITISGNYVYAVDYDNDVLDVFNVSTPSSPTLAGSAATGYNATAVAVSGTNAYVTNYDSNTLQIFNVSTPSSPVLTSSIATNQYPQYVAVSGNYAYVVNQNYGNTLQVFNISNPASPTLDAGSAVAANVPNDVVTVGNYMYVLNNGSNALQIFNISTPASPSLVGSVTTDTQPVSFAVSGNYAYVLSSSALQIFDISTPSSPTLVGSYAESGPNVTSNSVAVSGNYVYVTTVSSTAPYPGILQVFNVSTPSAPTQVDSVTLPDEQTVSVHIAVSGSYAYVTDGPSSNEMQVFDISNPSSVTQVGSAISLGNANSTPYDITISGNYAYVLNSNGTYGSPGMLQVFDISNPNSVTQVGSNIATDSGPESIAISGNYAYVTDTLTNEIQAFNISSPAAVTVIGSVPVAPAGYPTSIALSGSGNYAYVADEQADIVQVFNTSQILGSMSKLFVLQDASGNNLDAFDASGNLTIAPANNSLAALRVENSDGTTALGVDTVDNVVGIGAAPTWSGATLQVTGSLSVSQLETSSDTVLCYDRSNGDLATCNSGAGNGSFIYNASSLQTSANINIQSSSAGTATAQLEAVASQTADLLDLENSSGTVLSGFTASGALQAGNASGSNAAGTNLVLNGGQGTGTGNGGNIVFQYSPAGASGSSLNALQTACQISGADGSLSCPGTGSSSERFGAGSQATGSESVAIGNGATANYSGTGDAVAIGYHANTGQTSVAVGYAATSGTSGVALGSSANSYVSGVALGEGASTSGNYDVAIGRIASASYSGGNGDTVVIGDSSASSAQNAVAIGSGATANGGSSVGIGANVNVNTISSIGIGYNATTTASNQLVVNGVSTGYFGNGVTNSAPSDFSLQATGSSSAGTAGASFTLQGGAGATTGAGSAGGDLILAGANAGGTGNNNGGNITLQGGSATGTGTGGKVIVKNLNNSDAAFEVQNAGGTTTDLVNLIQSSGTVTNGIKFTGTFTNLIESSAFQVSNGGTIDTTGGALLSGTVSLNAGSGTHTTNIGTGSTTGAVTIGGGSDTLTINTSSWDVSSAGAISGVTTLSMSGAITSGTWNGTAIGAAYGGTGLTSYTVGDILYASGTTTLSALSDVATGSCLVSGGTGAAPSWGSCATGTVLLAPASAQTDSSTNSSIFINKTGSSGNLLQLQKGGADVLTIGNTGSALFKNSTNSTTAFQVQDASGNIVLGVDTSGDQLLSGIPSGGNAFVLNTTASYSSGYLLLVKNNGTTEFSVDYAGNVVANSIAANSITVGGKSVCTTAANCAGMPLVTYSETTTTNHSLAASTWTAIDTLPSFTVPASGTVRVQVFGGQWQTNGNAVPDAGIMISGTVQSSTVQNEGWAGGNASNAYVPPYELDVILTGLTPGANETLQLGGYVPGTNGNLYTGAGSPGSGVLTAIVSVL